MPSGVFGLRPGPLMAAVDSFDLVVEGMGGHGAMPHRSVDPVVVAADVVGALQRVVSREIDPVEPAVLTIGAINGGTTYNVIPPRVALKGTVRTFTDATRDTMEARVQRIAEHTCAAANATCSLQWHPSYPVTVNDPAEAAFVTATLDGGVRRGTRAARPRRSWAAKTSRTSRRPCRRASIFSARATRRTSSPTTIPRSTSTRTR